MAAPNPLEELDKAQKLAARGLPPLVLVSGANGFFRAEALDRLLAAVPKAAELRIVDAVDERAGGGPDDDDAEGAGGAAAEAGDPPALAQCPELQDLLGGGLFARQSFVVVRRAKNWWQKHGATVAAWLPRFLRGSGLIVEAPSLDKRRKVVAALVKATAEAGAAFEFRDLYDTPWDRSRSPAESELVKWVERRAKGLGVPLTAEAAYLLVVEVGKSLADLAAELGRLRDQLGADPRRAPLAPADLRGKVTCSFESSPFEFAEAVLARDRVRARRSLRAMFDRGVRGKDGKAMDEGGVAAFATSWMFQSLARVHEGRLLLDSGVPPRDLPARAAVFQFADRFVEQVVANDRQRLRTGLLALHQCQRAIRRSGEGPALLLERFLAQWFDGAPLALAEDLGP